MRVMQNERDDCSGEPVKKKVDDPSITLGRDTQPLSITLRSIG